MKQIKTFSILNISSTNTCLYVLSFMQPWDVQNFDLKNYSRLAFHIYTSKIWTQNVGEKFYYGVNSTIYIVVFPLGERLLYSQFSGGKTTLGGKVAIQLRHSPYLQLDWLTWLKFFWLYTSMHKGNVSYMNLWNISLNRKTSICIEICDTILG